MIINILSKFPHSLSDGYVNQQQTSSVYSNRKQVVFIARASIFFMGVSPH